MVVTVVPIDPELSEYWPPPHTR